MTPVFSSLSSTPSSPVCLPPPVRCLGVDKKNTQTRQSEGCLQIDGKFSRDPFLLSPASVPDTLRGLDRHHVHGLNDGHTVCSYVLVLARQKSQYSFVGKLTFKIKRNVEHTARLQFFKFFYFNFGRTRHRVHHCETKTAG